MAKSNRKKATFAQKELARRRVFYHRLRNICLKMVGEGYFELLPESSLRLLYVHRYPPIKIVLDGKRVMDEQELAAYKQMLAGLLSEHYIDIPSGQQISYARFMTDVLVLLHYVQYRIGNRFKGFSKLWEAFSPYFTTTEWFEKQKTKILQIMGMNDMYLYDFYRGTVRFRFDRMAIEQLGGTNEIRIYRLRHSTLLQEVEGKKRVIVKMGIPSSEKVDKLDWLMITPSQLGIPDMEDGISLPLYAQQHALERFEERTLFTKGYVQAYLGYLFTEGNPKTIVRKNHVLLECYLGIHKVGYFVISLHEDKWLLRTFLFLTNEGTPEGNRLKKLTQLEILDKKYLMLDRMDAFLTYDISGDERLRTFFVKAGCGSIMEYADELNRNDDNLKSPEFIYRYLSRSNI
ncbi:hypothetical protein [Sphingobacterium hotanense]|uniref:hypothetical protein n=1 Tax=Sphingobacterium hotanense TaxID=649196 RepID=UPI0021A7BAE7|nr:hypothetical protein [Sphingobacterium hotanense]MCT1526077.1 hypothetical protein [Sphingobacterium hotanense]